MRIEANNSAVFDSLADVHQFMSANMGMVLDVSNDLSWYGGASVTSSVDMLVAGDQSQVEAAKRMSDKFDIRIETHGQALGQGVAGFYPCVPEYLGGAPESMYCMVDSETQMSPLKIIVDSTSSSGVGSEMLRKRGITILAATMALSAMRPVSLEVVCTLDVKPELRSGGKNFSSIRVPINSAPLDLGSACYALCHPGFARRICYGLVRNLFGGPLIWPKLPDVDMHDTRSQKTTIATLKEIGEDPEQCLFIPAISLKDELVDEPEKWISKTLAKYGQPALT